MSYALVKPTPLVIWCNQRSGSTHLSSLLASHPEIACWRELLFVGEGSAQDDYFTRSKSKDLAAFLSSFFNYDWGPRGINLRDESSIDRVPGAVGFKLKYGQAWRYPTVLDCLFRYRDTLRVIHLVRTNLVATLVSSLMLPTLFVKFGNSNVLVDAQLAGLDRSVWVDPKASFPS